MNGEDVLATVQRWRRPRYSARPFALTILAIALITLLAWGKALRPVGINIERRDLMAPTLENQEVETP